jgi:hypothetical protein
MPTSRLKVALPAALLVVVAASLAPLTAQSSMLVIATGLDNPRGLSFGPDGALYVAEAGRGGSSTLCVPTPEPPFALTRCLGPTGAITRITGLNQQQRIVTNLPSVAVQPAGNTAAGPSDVDFGFGSMWITISIGGNPSTRAPLEAAGIRMGWLARASMNGDWSYQIDLAAYEATANPDGLFPDSNPVRLLIQPDRGVFVDAGGNALNQIGTDRAISTLAVFPQKPVPGGTTTMDSVPTSVAAAPDGQLYVGELTGVPFPPGAAAIYRVPASGGTPVEVAAGFSMIIDLAIGRDGAAYVVEHDIDGLFGPGSDGRQRRPDPPRWRRHWTGRRAVRHPEQQRCRHRRRRPHPGAVISARPGTSISQTSSRKWRDWENATRPEAGPSDAGPR